MNKHKLSEQTTTMQPKTYLPKMLALWSSALLFSAMPAFLSAESFFSDPLHWNWWTVDAGVDQNICVGESAQLMATGANSYIWSPASGLSCTTCPDPIASPAITTTYFAMGDDGTVDSVTVTVFSPPQIVSVASGDPTDCNLPNGTISVNAQGNGPLEYSIDGGVIWQNDGIFTAIPSGNYAVVIRNVGGACVVQGPTITLQAPNAPEILSVIKTDPTFCDTPNGAIIISAFGGISPLQFSIDGGMSWQNSNTFQLLPSGIYDTRVRNADGACEIIGGTVTLSGSPDEPDITAVLPFGPSDCVTPDGLITIIVSNDTGNFEYSIDGGNSFQPGNSFTGLTEGIYEIIVRKNDGTCSKTGGFVDLVSSLHPTLFGTSVIQPSDCGSNDGNITILAFGQSSLEYSVNGGATYQTSNIFNNLSGGNYQVAIRNSNGTCPTLGDIIQLVEPTNPDIQSVNLTNPTNCSVPNGVINISATGSGTLEYSLDGGANWNPNSIFNGLPAGNYTVVVREVGTSCSTAYQNNPVQLTSSGNAPSIDNIIITNPTDCDANNGSLTIQTSGNPNFIYSINNGVTFQSSNVFTGLFAGTYAVVVALPGNQCPVFATANVTHQQSCMDTVGFIIPPNPTTTVCIDQSVFSYPGQFTSFDFCGQGNTATVFATSITGECITVQPANGFSGQSPDLICTIHCFDNSPLQCDTTYIQITIESPVGCDPVFPVDTVDVPFTGNPTPYCVPIPLSSIPTYDLEFQGVPLSNPFVCDPDQTVAYSYGFLPGGGSAGPYTLNFWAINGNTFSGTFSDPQGLTDLMNSIDPTGFWQNDSQGSFIFGGNSTLQYGNMEIIQNSSGIPTTLMTNFTVQPQGFTVQMTNPGEHILIATDPVTGCSDTLVINAMFDFPETETVVLNTPVNTPTDPYCLDGLELPNAVIDIIGFCSIPSNGGAPITSDSCITYIPNFGFAGQDQFCVVVCDNSFPLICDTTFFVVNVLPETDTVFLNIPTGEISIDTCLSNFIIELPGAIDQASFCSINNNQLTGTINANCLIFSTIGNFSGVSEVCLITCSGGVCDTTVLFVNVAPPFNCDDVFTQEEIVIPSAIAQGFLCIPIPPSEIGGYNVTVDGNAFIAFTPCDYGDVLIYNYNSIPLGGFTLDSWTVNGLTFMGTFPNIQTLVDSMNVWDPMGGWENNVNGSTISGGASGNNYGNLVITGNLGGIFNISPDLVLLPLGSNLEITGFGSYQVIVSQANGCADTATVILEQQLVTTETLFFETNLNTSVTPICATTNELIGDLQTFNLCGLPANGSISIIGDTCVSYTPNLNFTGTDGFCLVVCDDYQPIVCDTFYVVIQTQLPVDTVFVDAVDVVPFDECLDGSVLQLPGNIDTAFICASNPAEVELGFVGNCVTIDLADNFVGITTACVVHCTSDVPPICDTTYLVIEFDGVFPCDNIFTPDQVNVMLSNDTGEVCLPIPVMDINDYTVFLDGTVYTGQLTGCDVDSIYTYFYSQVFGQGNAGPYDIKWLLNGVNQTATVIDMVALVNLMNGLDPAGMWVLDQNMLTITSSNDSGDYGLLEIAHPSGTVAGLTPNFNGVPNGTLVVFTGSGQHEVVLVENFTNCDDTLFINAVAALDTIQITTFENTPSAQTCIDTTGLQGNFVEMTICGNPTNGAILIDEECFIYIPNGGFTGNDEACLQICDDLGNCEIWIVEISVVPLCSQFNFFPDGVISIAAPDCAALAEYCFPIEIDSLVNFGVLDNGVPYTNFTPCNGNFSQISLDTGFHEIIVVHLLTQCSDTLLVNVTCQADNGCGIMALNDLDLLATDCDSLTEFCVNVAVNDLANFVVTDNGQPAAEVGPCSTNPQFVGVALDTGFHEVVFADTVKGCVDTFLVNINCFTVEDSTIDVQVIEGDSLEICLDDYDFPINLIDSLVNICDSQSDGEASFVIDPTTWCITIYGETVGQDTFCFKAYFGDTCAVLTVNVDVISNCPDYFPNDQLLVTTSCNNDSALVCLPLDVSILENLEIEVNGQPMSMALVPCGFDSLLVFPYFELPNNGMIGPYVINDWTINGVTVTGTFDSATELADSMSVWDPTGNWAVSTNNNGNSIIVGGNLNSVYGAMTVEQTLFGNIVTLDILLEISSSNLGLLLPIGASTVTFTDTLTNCAETIVVDVSCIQMDTVEMTVEIGAVDTFCLDLTELLGNVVSVENICEDLSGTDVSFEIIGECVVFTGIDPGADTACLVVCDDVGICDTTILIVTAEVMGVDTFLIAVDDNVTTGEGQVLNIDVLQNDIFVTLTDFNIIDDPLHGQAAFSPNGDINYVPDIGYCDDEEPDFFTYEICNASGCDTATVFVLVQCSELEIFNAISPNEDGKNDFFRIKGLQNYPNHKLFIYNRWGNLVHEAINYQSDWDGTWDGKDLPDGTYFYVLDLGEGDKPMKGYVQINR